jgi:hypothetical protein
VPLKNDAPRKDAEPKKETFPKKDSAPKKEIKNNIRTGKSKGQGKDPPKKKQQGPGGEKKPVKGRGFIT